MRIDYKVVIENEEKKSNSTVLGKFYILTMSITAGMGKVTSQIWHVEGKSITYYSET